MHLIKLKIDSRKSMQRKQLHPIIKKNYSTKFSTAQNEQGFGFVLCDKKGIFWARYKLVQIHLAMLPIYRKDRLF